MKKLFGFLALVCMVTMLFSGCQKDEVNDSDAQSKEVTPMVDADSGYVVALKSDGTVITIKDDAPFGKGEVSDWNDIVEVATNNCWTMGLKQDGTVVTTLREVSEENIPTDWFIEEPDIDEIREKCNRIADEVESWEDVVAISTGMGQLVGLKSDGTVVAAGTNQFGECDVSGWRDIVAISSGDSHTVGLKSDGTVVAVGQTESGKCDVENWTDIVAISAASSHTVGLKSDGTVVATGWKEAYGEGEISEWTDIVAIATGLFHTVGLKSDGTVVAVGWDESGEYGLEEHGECDVSEWTDIVAIAADDYRTFGIKSDGSVVWAGHYSELLDNLEDWDLF